MRDECKNRAPQGALELDDVTQGDFSSFFQLDSEKCHSYWETLMGSLKPLDATPGQRMAVQCSPGENSKRFWSKNSLMSLWYEGPT